MKMVSLNVEGELHKDKIAELIHVEQAEVVCLQEFFPETAKQILGERYPYQFFVPTYRVDQTEKGLIPSETRVWGEVIASQIPFIKTEKFYMPMDAYTANNLPVHGTDNHLPTLLVAELGNGATIATTHFTWTPKASVTARQRAQVRALAEVVNDRQMVVVGDFNIPRGNEMYAELTRIWTDNIPKQVESTLDPELHYANREEKGRLKLVVDYVWSTTGYKVSEVEVVKGVSDHCAIVAQVDKGLK